MGASLRFPPRAASRGHRAEGGQVAGACPQGSSARPSWAPAPSSVHLSPSAFVFLAALGSQLFLALFYSVFNL